MHIIVCIKHVPDTETPITLSSDQGNINLQNVKWVMNPYDEYAMEQALQLKALYPGSSITALRIGPDINPEILRTAIAMGVDEGILVETNDFLDSNLTAKAIVGAIRHLGITPQFLCAGKKAIDLDAGQVPAIIAELMGLPLLTDIATFEKNEPYLMVQKESTGQATEIYQATPPCVISATKGPWHPRYPSLPGILKAKNKKLIKLTLPQVGVNSQENQLRYRQLFLPTTHRQGCIYTPGDGQETQTVIQKLIGRLRAENKVI